MPYNVIDRKTGVIMGTYGTLKGATRKSNTLDNEYGGYRFGVEKIQAKNNRSKLKMNKTA